MGSKMVVVSLLGGIVIFIGALAFVYFFSPDVKDSSIVSAQECKSKPEETHMLFKRLNEEEYQKLGVQTYYTDLAVEDELLATVNLWKLAEQNGVHIEDGKDYVVCEQTDLLEGGEGSSNNCLLFDSDLDANSLVSTGGRVPQMEDFTILKLSLHEAEGFDPANKGEVILTLDGSIEE